MTAHNACEQVFKMIRVHESRFLQLDIVLLSDVTDIALAILLNLLGNDTDGMVIK